MASRRKRILMILGIVVGILLVLSGVGYYEIKRRMTIPTPIIEPPDPEQPLFPQAKVSIRRGLDWLAELQHENGAWSNTNFPALTALPLLAFVRSDYPEMDAIRERAATFVAGFAQPDGGIYRPKTSSRIIRKRTVG